jgi:hypothetical protein
VAKIAYMPKIVLCVVGNWEPVEQLEELLTDVEHEFQDGDERMVETFESSACRVTPSMTDDDYEAIRNHTAVVYLLSQNYAVKDAGRICFEMLETGVSLLEIGGVGMKCESSGIAHSAERWKELAAQVGDALTALDSEEEDEKEDALLGFWEAFRDAYVRLPIADENGDLYSCGMHLLGKPDFVISAGVMPALGEDEGDQVLGVVLLFRVFALYLLGECSPGALETGQTFQVDDESPSFPLRHEPCTRYEEDDFFFNPYGQWRFELPE